MKKILFLLFVFVPSTILTNPLYHFYTPFFGNQNASEPYQKLVQQAYNDYAQNGCTIPVKKMNSLVSKLVGGQLYSFTMFGIWLDEDLLDAVDESVRKWIIYHEVAHYILGHHAKALGLVATMVPLFGVTNVCSQNAYGRLQGSIIAGLFAYGLHLYALKPYIKEQEKEADLAVVRILCATQQHTIVDEYLAHLKNFIDDGMGDSTDGWHYSIVEQYEYITSTYHALLA